jgi:hypothetical protein
MLASVCQAVARTTLGNDSQQLDRNLLGPSLESHCLNECGALSAGNITLATPNEPCCAVVMCGGVFFGGGGVMCFCLLSG